MDLKIKFYYNILLLLYISDIEVEEILAHK